MIKNRIPSILEGVLILAFSLFPLVMSFPYRINIFLSWEGAYRLSEGQIPFRDFGMPLGFVYWLVPAAFFKLFGPYMLSLVKAQAFINLISLISFREILKHFKLEQNLRIIVLLLFCLSFVLINFWPWYNHTVFVYQLLSLMFLLKGSGAEKTRTVLICYGLSSLFITLSFFTKQDGGALGLLVNLFLLAYLAWQSRNLWFPLYYVGLTVLFFLAFILPFVPYDFGYWFNYGQEPHFSRLDSKDLLFFWFQGSFWLKLYAVLIVIIILSEIKKVGWMNYLKDRDQMVFTLVTLGILVQASIIQVTSYVPINNNIYFHSFGLAFIVSHVKWPFDQKKLRFLVAGSLLLMIWWSGSYYKYVDRVIARVFPEDPAVVKDRVSVRNYTSEGEELVTATNWIEPKGMRSFKGIYMPETTVAGINRIKDLALWDSLPQPKVLNMTELTPLAYELGFELETGPEVPLWHHLNVSFFDRELELYKNRIAEGYYDLILFENIPNLNNFYPFVIRDYLLKYYRKADVFDAPRKHGGDPTIEVFIRPNSQ